VPRSPRKFPEATTLENFQVNPSVFPFAGQVYVVCHLPSKRSPANETAGNNINAQTTAKRRAFLISLPPSRMVAQHSPGGPNQLDGREELGN
jgi:hypothetical protein